MTIDEAIERLEKRYVTVSICASYEDALLTNQAIKMGIDELRAKKESYDSNVPLSIPELLTMDEQPVWISDGKEEKGWRIVDAMNKFLCGISENNEIIYCGTDYNAYRHPVDD